MMKYNQSAISSAEQVAYGDDVGTTCSVLRLRREDFAGSVGRKLFVCVDWDGYLEFFQIYTAKKEIGGGVVFSRDVNRCKPKYKFAAIPFARV